MSERQADSPFTVPTLRGIILRDETDKVIVQATPSEVREFAPRPGQEVAVRPDAPRVRARMVPAHYGGMYFYGASRGVGWPWPRPQLDEEDESPTGAVGRLRHNDFLYDRDGRPVARMTEINVLVPTAGMGMSLLGDAAAQVASGDVFYEIRARGLPGVTLLG